MSIGWGFLSGAGQALYDVQDQKIKDGMMHRRDLRNREWQMELEQYRTGARREETAEERSYLERQSEIEAGRATKLQELKGKQAMDLQKAKPGAAGGKRFKSIAREIPEGGQELFSFDQSTGKYIPYGGAGQGQGLSEPDLNARADEWISVRLGAYATNAELKAAAKEIGFTGDPDRNSLRFAYKESLRGGGGIGAGTPSAVTATEAVATPDGVTEGIGVQITDEDKAEAREAQKSRKALRAFMKKRGKTEEEIKQAEKEIFGGKTDEKKAAEKKPRVSAGMITGLGAEQPVRQTKPEKEQRKEDAPAMFEQFADTPERQKYAVFRIYSPYWTVSQRKKAKQMMPKVAKPKKPVSSYMGL